MRGRRDLLDIIEKAYVLEGSDAEWFDGIAETVHANLPFRALGVVVNGYDISDPQRPVFTKFHYAGVEWLADSWTELVKYFETDPERTRASYGCLDEGLGLEIPVPGGERLAAAFRRFEMGDVYGVNGRNPSGQGCFVGIALPPRFDPIGRGVRRTFARIARHLAAAHRLRQRLTTLERADPVAQAEAVITTHGKIEHAEGAARSEQAREALRRSVVTLASVRGRRRLDDPEKAIAAWKALVDARWSLVDHFERGGRQYLVAHRNDCQPAPLALLTERERQVVALAAMGHSNKSIAYDLGIATSTVGVLVSRALRRLGLRSRHELRRLYLTQRAVDDS